LERTQKDEPAVAFVLCIKGGAENVVVLRVVVANVNAAVFLYVKRFVGRVHQNPKDSRLRVCEFPSIAARAGKLLP
jgi:hypothetical protein